MSSLFLTTIAEYMYQRRYAKRTISAYQYWISQFIRFHSMQHPASMGDNEVECFLNHLVNDKNVAANTQASALNALSFLYKDIIKSPLSLQLNFIRSQQVTKLPTVLTQDEVKRLLQHVSIKHHLIVCLLYGSGLRLMEAVRLRVKDINYDFKCIEIWQSKGGKSRVVTLADELLPALRTQVLTVSQYHDKDLHFPQFAGVWSCLTDYA